MAVPVIPGLFFCLRKRWRLDIHKAPLWLQKPLHTQHNIVSFAEEILRVHRTLREQRKQQAQVVSLPALLTFVNFVSSLADAELLECMHTVVFFPLAIYGLCQHLSLPFLRSDVYKEETNWHNGSASLLTLWSGCTM